MNERCEGQILGLGVKEVKGQVWGLGMKDVKELK